MKIFKYEVQLTNDNDEDYYKTGIVISDCPENAEKEVFNEYNQKTMDYVSPSVSLLEIKTDRKAIIENI